MSWQVFAVALPIALLATFIPISANGIGVREGVLVVLLLRDHVSLPMATALALFVDLQLVPFAILGGLVYLAEHGWLHRPLWLARQVSVQMSSAMQPRLSSTPAPERVVDGRDRNR